MATQMNKEQLMLKKTIQNGAADIAMAQQMAANEASLNAARADNQPTTPQQATNQQAATQQQNASPTKNASPNQAPAIQSADYAARLQELGGGNYAPSANVAAAQQYLNSIAANRPADYQSKYGNQLDALYKQIMNREKFSYDLNGDALYQQYKDAYQLMGQQAMQDTMGQAAAMTGGYGSSYANTVGQQTYQGYIQKLNEIAPQLRQQAFDIYQQEGQDLQNRYAITQSAEQQDYGRWQDAYSRWQDERSYARSAYDSERSFDYNDYTNSLNTAMNLLGYEHQDKTLAAEQAYQDSVREAEYARQDALRQQEYAREDALRAEDIAREDALIQSGYDREDALRAEENARQDQLIQNSYDREDQLRAEDNARQDALIQQGYDREDALRQEGYDRQDQLLANEYAREDIATNKQQAYTYAMAMITKGALPSDDILAAAEISLADAKALAKKYGYYEKSSSSSKKNNSSSGNTTSTPEKPAYVSSYEEWQKKFLG